MVNINFRVTKKNIFLNLIVHKHSSLIFLWVDLINVLLNEFSYKRFINKYRIMNKILSFSSDYLYVYYMHDDFE
jgi:hypothetical protein